MNVHHDAGITAVRELGSLLTGPAGGRTQLRQTKKAINFLSTVNRVFGPPFSVSEFSVSSEISKEF